MSNKPAVAAIDDRDGKIRMDGSLVDWRDAKIHVPMPTLHHGMSVFEQSANGTSIVRL